MDQATKLRELTGRTEVPLTDALITYRRLWLDGKQELADLVAHGGKAPRKLGLSFDETFWDGVRYALTRMEQAEVLAMFKEGGNPR